MIRVDWRDRAIKGGVPVVLAAVLSAGFIAGCNRGSRDLPPGASFPTSTTSPKLSAFTFKEEGRRYLLTVGVNVTRWHDEDQFVPFTVVLANKTESKIRLTRESFTLIDPVSGARYGLATVQEVRAQGKQSYDAQIARTDMDHFGTKLDVFQRTESNFFPFQGLVHDEIELHQFQFIAENLYFPRPEGQLLGKTFELHVNSRDLDQSLFVVFTVPEREK